MVFLYGANCGQSTDSSSMYVTITWIEFSEVNLRLIDSHSEFKETHFYKKQFMKLFKVYNCKSCKIQKLETAYKIMKIQNFIRYYCVK